MHRLCSRYLYAEGEILVGWFKSQAWLTCRDTRRRWLGAEVPRGQKKFTSNRLECQIHVTYTSRLSFVLLLFSRHSFQLIKGTWRGNNTMFAVDSQEFVIVDIYPVVSPFRVQCSVHPGDLGSHINISSRVTLQRYFPWHHLALIHGCICHFQRVQPRVQLIFQWFIQPNQIQILWHLKAFQRFRFLSPSFDLKPTAFGPTLLHFATAAVEFILNLNFWTWFTLKRKENHRLSFRA